ncbi:MAG: iron-containing alcohol dehydrogenase [Desulfobacteraceae bacterium]|jgi:glycerol-1-phosphate dehydrogenase [NAD(P)+]
MKKSQWERRKTPVADPKAYGRYCTCGGPHPTVDTAYFAGKNAAVAVADDLKKIDPQGSVLVLADENTHRAAGRTILAYLERQRIDHARLTLPGNISATDRVADEVYRHSAAHDLILAVGAGTINDLGKYAAGRQGRPYWVFPTAPSMNGYTSAIAAIKVEGVKRTLPAPPPRFIYIDPDIIGGAPLKLIQSGYCDILAKSVSDVDWQIESLLFSGSYCRLPSAIVAQAETSYLDRPEDLRQTQKTTTVMALTKGLLVSGAAMTLAGSSAPASGGEHLFSHFLDMRESITGRVPDLHGLQVAAGIIVSAACYRRLAKLDAGALPCRGHEIYQQESKKIPGIWKTIADDVQKRFAMKSDALLALDRLLPKQWGAVRALCRKVRSPRYYARQMRRTGYALTINALNLDPQEFMLAATSSLAIRERITVLDIAAHAGVLEAAATDALVILDNVS